MILNRNSHFTIVEWNAFHSRVPRLAVHLCTIRFVPFHQRIGIQRSATLRKLRPRFFNSRHFASKCHIRHNSSYSASIAMATYCFNLAAILAVSVMHSSSRVITRDQQAKIADTTTRKHLGKRDEWHFFVFLFFDSTVSFSLNFIRHNHDCKAIVAHLTAIVTS